MRRPKRLAWILAAISGGILGASSQGWTAEESPRGPEELAQARGFPTEPAIPGALGMTRQEPSVSPGPDVRSSVEGPSPLLDPGLTALPAMAGMEAEEGPTTADVEAAEAAEEALQGARAAAATDPANTIGLLGAAAHPLDLNMALRLAGVQNPELNVARRRVLEAVAVRQLAAAQLLPTLNAGMNYDVHTGVLQQSNGNILSTNRSALYVGAGANAVAAGTVGIPGVVLDGNLAVRIFNYLESRQIVEQREFENLEVRNQVFLETALAYSELIRAEGQRAIALQNRAEVAEIARLTANFAEVGEGRQADADRAASELASRVADWQRAEGQVLVASARLAQAINVDPSVRLHPTDSWAVPLPIVPDPIPVPQLIAIALMQRPELASRRAAVRAALLALDSAKFLPFSPNYIIGYSGGGFGGGSNLVRPVFGGFGGRTDFDLVAYWSIMNMGVGNSALIRQARASLQVAHFELIGVLNRTRAEVAESYALTHARFAQIESTEQAVRAGLGAFERDLVRIRERAGEERARVLPIELLNSFQLLANSRQAYLDAIVDYNNAQFSLYVALGQPPADMLARPVPAEGVAPTPMDTPITTPAPTSPFSPNQPGRPNGPTTAQPVEPKPLAMADRPNPPTAPVVEAPHRGVPLRATPTAAPSRSPRPETSATRPRPPLSPSPPTQRMERAQPTASEDVKVRRVAWPWGRRG